MRDARLWMQDILAGGDAGKSDKDRRTLANDITQLRLLSTHVPFDTSNLRWTAGAVRAMQDRVAALTPIVSAVEDRMRALPTASRCPRTSRACWPAFPNGSTPVRAPPMPRALRAPPSG